MIEKVQNACVLSTSSATISSGRMPKDYCGKSVPQDRNSKQYLIPLFVNKTGQPLSIVYAPSEISMEQLMNSYLRIQPSESVTYDGKQNLHIKKVASLKPYSTLRIQSLALLGGMIMQTDSDSDENTQLSPKKKNTISGSPARMSRDSRNSRQSSLSQSPIRKTRQRNPTITTSQIKPKYDVVDNRYKKFNSETIQTAIDDDGTDNPFINLFKSMQINTLVRKLNDISPHDPLSKEYDQLQYYVTIDQLREQFYTPEWQQVLDDGNQRSQSLIQNLFTDFYGSIQPIQVKGNQPCYGTLMKLKVAVCHCGEQAIQPKKPLIQRYAEVALGGGAETKSINEAGSDIVRVVQSFNVLQMKLDFNVIGTNMDPKLKQERLEKYKSADCFLICVTPEDPKAQKMIDQQISEIREISTEAKIYLIKSGNEDGKIGNLDQIKVDSFDDDAIYKISQKVGSPPGQIKDAFDLIIYKELEAKYEEKALLELRRSQPQLIDKRCLIAFGLIHCLGKPQHKAIAMFSILPQKSFHSTNVAKREGISIRLVFLIMCRMATEKSLRRSSQLSVQDEQFFDIQIQQQFIRWILQVNEVREQAIIQVHALTDLCKDQDFNWIFSASQICQRLSKLDESQKQKLAANSRPSNTAISLNQLKIQLRERALLLQQRCPEQLQSLKQLLETLTVHKKLSVEQQEQVCTVFSYKIFDFESIDPEYGYERDVEAEILDIINSNRRERQFHAMRAQKFMLNYSIKYPAFKSSITAQLEQLDLYQDLITTTASMIKLDQQYVGYRPLEKQNLTQTFREILPPFTQKERMCHLLKKLDIYKFLQLLVILPRGTLNIDMLPKDAYNQRLFAQFYDFELSNDNDSLLIDDFLLSALHDLSIETEQEIIAQLENKFAQQNPSNQLKLLKTTRNQRLKYLWLQKVQPEFFKEISVTEKVNLLNGCTFQVPDILSKNKTEEQKQAIIAQRFFEMQTHIIQSNTDLSLADQAQSVSPLPERVVTQFLRQKTSLQEQNKMKLKSVGQELSQKLTKVEIDNFGPFRQCIPLPGQPYHFICIQSQLKSSKTDKDESHDFVKENQSEKQTMAQVKVSKSRIYDKEEIQQACQSIAKTHNTEIDPKETLSYLIPEKEYFNEMNLELQNQENSKSAWVPKGLVSIWKYQVESENFSCIKSIKIDEPLAFRGSSYFSDEHFRQIFLYRGRDNEIFWFCVGDEKEVELQILYPKDFTPKSYKIGPTSRLYKHITEGNDKGKSLQFINPVPTLIKDSPNSYMIVFTSFQWGDSSPSVQFYDLNTQREIAFVQNAQIFMQFLPESRGFPAQLFLFNEFVWFGKSKNKLIKNELDLQIHIGEATQQSNVYNANGQTKWLTCKVDFKKCRRFQKCQEIGSGLSSQQKNIQKVLMSNDRRKIKEVCQELSHGFILVEGDDVDFEESWYQKSTIQVVPMKTRGLFSLAIVSNNSFDPELNKTFVYEVESSKKVRKIMQADGKDSKQLGSETVLKQYFAFDDLDEQQSILIEFGNEDDEPDVEMRITKGPNYNVTTSSTWFKQDIGRTQFQRPCLIDNKLLGGYISSQGALTWYSMPLQLKENCVQQVKEQFSDFKNLDYMIDYPIMCHIKPYKNIVITNLADKQQQKRSLYFDEEFIMFIGMNRCKSGSRIAFLAKSLKSKNMIVIMIRHITPFLKEEGNDLSQISVQRFVLDSTFDELGQELLDSRKAYLLESPIVDQTYGQNYCRMAILFQTQSTIILYQNGKFEDVRSKSNLVDDAKISKINLKRGFNNYFYYIEQEESSVMDLVIELKLSFDDRLWSVEKKIIFSGYSGKIVAMELDRDKQLAMDTYWDQDGIIQSNKPAKNQIFIVGNQPSLLKLRQKPEGEAYQVLLKIDLSFIKGLKSKLNSHLKDDKSSICISDRSITISGANFVYQTGQKFEEFSAHKEFKDWTILDSKNEEISQQNVHVLQNKGTGQFALVVKNDPSSRKCCLLGKRSQQDVTLHAFISSDTLLLQIRTDRTKEFYWTLVDSQAQIHALPISLQRVLQSEDWKELSSKVTSKGMTQLLLKSERKVASIMFDNHRNILDLVEFELSQDDFVQDKFLSDFDGKLFRMAMLKSEKEPKLQISQRVIRGISLTQVVFLNGEQGTDFIICGNYLCWRKPLQQKISVLSLQKMIDMSSKENSVIDYSEYLRKIPLQNLLEEQNPSSLPISLDYCEPLYTLHAFPNSELDEQRLRDKSNLLQVTIVNTGIIYDLSQEQDAEDKIPAIKEIPAMHDLIEPQKYVESGIRMTDVQELESYSGRKFFLKKSIQANKPGNLYCLQQESNLKRSKDTSEPDKDQDFNSFMGLYRTFSELDLVELKRIQEAIRLNKKLKFIDTQTLFATFNGLSLFSFFEGELRLYTSIFEKLHSQNYKNVEDKDQTEVEHPDLRRIVNVLTQKCYNYNNEKQKAEFSTIFHRNLSNVAVRDILLQIANLCQSFCLFNDIYSVEQVDELLKTATPELIQELQTCFSESKSTRKILTLEWPSDMQVLTYRSSSCMTTQKELQKEVKRVDKVNAQEKGAGLLVKAITVKVLNIEWLMNSESKFLALVQILRGHENSSLFQNDFIMFILDEFWEENYFKIFWYQFIPYVSYCISAIYYMKLGLEPEMKMDDPKDPRFMLGLAILTLILWTYIIYNELTQFIYTNSKLEYLNDFWNMLDLFQLPVTFMVIMFNEIDTAFIDIHYLRILASLASCFLIMKVYDWMRLFERTSFYILLIQETISDIRSFMLLFILGLLMFGMPLTMLDKNRNDDIDMQIQASHSKTWLLNVLIDQYYLSLGAFEVAQFTYMSEGTLCLAFFILATFFSQVTMLNMLIAIMGDTFGRVMENKQLNATRTKLDLMGDLVHNLRSSRTKTDPKIFMFAVTPDEGSQSKEDSWQGSVTTLDRLAEKRITELKSTLTKQISKLQVQVETQSTRDAAQEKDMKKQMMQMLRTMQDKSDRKILSLETKINDLGEIVRDSVSNVNGLTQAINLKVNGVSSTLEQDVANMQNQLQQVLSIVSRRQ